MTIKSADGKPVENAVVQLIPLEKDETRGTIFVRDETDLSVFSISFFEGHQLSKKYKVIISADGFKNFETEMIFPHCKTRNFNLKLEKKNSDQKNSFEEIREINFWVYDADKKAIDGVKVGVYSEDEKISEEISGANGLVRFKVVNDKTYKIKLEKSGYKSKETEFDLSKTNFIYETITLEKIEP